MTKPRDPATFEAAALEILHHLSPEKAARIIDRTPGVVRKYADPESDGRPVVHHTLALDLACHAATGRTPFFSAYQHQLRLAIGDQATRAQLDPVLEALDVTEAVGRLAALVRAAKDHGGAGGAHLTPSERISLFKAIAEARQQIDELERAVRGDQ
jgi:hypothetical protein